MKRHLAAFLVGAVSICIFSNVLPAAPPSANGLWQEVPRPDETTTPAGAQPWVQLPVCRTYRLDPTAMHNQLLVAPHPNTQPATGAPIDIPMPDGTYQRFDVVQSPVMVPELAAQFPDIKTYLGRGLDDPAAVARLDFTPFGFHAQVLSPAGAVYVDPYWRGDTTLYASYYHRDYRKDGHWSCTVVHPDVVAPAGPPAQPDANDYGPTGANLRTYRLVCAATGEYTAFYGGTVNGAMAGIVTTVNRVVGIYELELSIHMNLVANNNLVVYTDAATDPYDNGDGDKMLGQNQTNLTTVIGSANYDIGHVFSTGGGGVAYVGCVCKASYKAGGVTGSTAPVGDAYDVDYVAHEMGHQFGANHSFNSTSGDCSGNRAASFAYEPGSGSTIMSYAGICGSDDLQPHSDPYFHSTSIEEITAYTTGTGGGTACDVLTATGNQIPTVNAGADYVIPQDTPFALTAAGSDADGQVLTYCWEQRDLGAARTLSAADNGASPLFRSWNPTTSPTRTLPRLSDLLANTLPVGEKMPTTNRTLHFRVTARDNRPGGGATNSDDASVAVTIAAGPFRVTAPNTAVTWGGAQTITWNVANTNLVPVSTTTVNILLSTDGGNTFPTVLAANTPNDGSEVVALPSLNTTTARIKVQAANSIYFDLSDVDFTIIPASFVAFADAGPRTVDDTLGNGNANGTLDPGESAVHLLLPIRNSGNIPATGVTATLTSLTDGLTVMQGASAYPDLAAGDTGANITDFVVAMNSSLACGSPAYLRLTVNSAQGGNPVDYVFTTGIVPGVPVTISYTGPAVAIADAGTINVPLTVASIGTIMDVNFRFDGNTCSSADNATGVGLSHTYVGDLAITLISPQGTQVVLLNRPGGIDNSGNNFCQTLFDDDGAFPSIQSCVFTQNPFTGTWQPATSLSTFDGQNPAGTWTLRVQDAAATDSGYVRAFSLIITPLTCPLPVAPADFNRDGYVNQADYQIFFACVTGAANPTVSDACRRADFNGDNDVDQSDFAVFQHCYSGTAPANAYCGN